MAMASSLGMSRPKTESSGRWAVSGPTILSAIASALPMMIAIRTIGSINRMPPTREVRTNLTMPFILLSVASGRLSVISGQSIDPVLILESLLQEGGDFLGGCLGPALDRGVAAGLPIDFHADDDDKSHRAAGDQPA